LLHGHVERDADRSHAVLRMKIERVIGLF